MDELSQLRVVHFTHRYAKGLRHTFSVGRIRFRAMTNMADLHLARDACKGASCVLEEKLLPLGAHETKEQPGLSEVVVVILAEVLV